MVPVEVGFQTKVSEFIDVSKLQAVSLGSSQHWEVPGGRLGLSPPAPRIKAPANAFHTIPILEREREDRDKRRGERRKKTGKIREG